MIAALAEGAEEVVVDKGYMRVQRRWYNEVAEAIPCLLTQVQPSPLELPQVGW